MRIHSSLGIVVVLVALVSFAQNNLNRQEAHSASVNSTSDAKSWQDLSV